MCLNFVDRPGRFTAEILNSYTYRGNIRFDGKNYMCEIDLKLEPETNFRDYAIVSELGDLNGVISIPRGAPENTGHIECRSTQFD